MRLMYSTVTAAKVALTEKFYGSLYRLYLADEFNPSGNQHSSNPYRIFEHWMGVFERNDFNDAKFNSHLAGLRQGVGRRFVRGTAEYKEARALIRSLGTHGAKPVIAILEADYVHGERQKNCCNLCCLYRI